MTTVSPREPLTEDTRAALAGRLHDAARSARSVPQITAEHPSLDVAEAYLIQDALWQLRKLEGFPLVGRKMGLTSRAKMEQVGVHEPISGALTRDMQVADGGELRFAEHCHPRVEPEVAFLLGKDIDEPLGPAQAMTAVDAVCCALEIIDSRYKDFRFTLPDVVADNASSSHFVLGSTLRGPRDLNLANLGMAMEVNGRVVQTGSSAAILEHPARSLAALTVQLAARGLSLKAGDVVLAGGATAAVPLGVGDFVQVRVDGLGSAGFVVR